MKGWGIDSSSVPRFVQPKREVAPDPYAVEPDAVKPDAVESADA